MEWRIHYGNVKLCNLKPFLSKLGAFMISIDRVLTTSKVLIFGDWKIRLWVLELDIGPEQCWYLITNVQINQLRLSVSCSALVRPLWCKLCSSTGIYSCCHHWQ